jgi:transcription elongation GreA/GreB family factor
VLGAKIGDELTFTAPNGKQREVKILDVKHFNG